MQNHSQGQFFFLWNYTQIRSCFIGAHIGTLESRVGTGTIYRNAILKDLSYEYFVKVTA